MQTRLNSTIFLFLKGSITAEHYFWSNDSGLMYIWHQFVRKLNSWIYYTHWLIWFFMSKRTFFSVLPGRVLLGWTTKQGLMCLDQGQNTVTLVMLELATTWIGLGSNTLILSHCAPILNYVFFLFLGTASRRPNEKHRSPLLVQADQSLRTLTAMVHAGMSDFYYFRMASRTDHHSPANCSLTFLIFGCLLSKNSQTHFFIHFTLGIKCFYEHKLSHKFW